PSSRITRSVSSGTDQSRRDKPPLVVSPETPALATVTSCPRSRRACSSRSVKPTPVSSWYPAMRLSPKPTMRKVSASELLVPEITINIGSSDKTFARRETLLQKTRKILYSMYPDPYSSDRTLLSHIGIPAVEFTSH